MMSVAMLRGLWRYRGFVLGSVQREFQSKYRNTMLGAAWTVLSPLAMILVYTLIFSQVMKSRLPGDTSEYGSPWVWINRFAAHNGVCVNG